MKYLANSICWKAAKSLKKKKGVLSSLDCKKKINKIEDG